MTSVGSFTTMSTASTKRPAAKKAGGSPPVYVGQTFRKVRLSAGERPFVVVSVDTDRDTASGWLFPDPSQDGEDLLLKELGIQSADRKRACYITVATDLVK